MRGTHGPTEYGKSDPLVPVVGERVRALLDGIELSNRQAARKVGVPAQTLDYLTSTPPKQRRARRSLVAALARLSEDVGRAPVPGAWLTGEALALISGSDRPAGYELQLHWTIQELILPMTRGARHLRPKDQKNATATMVGLASPDDWRRWLLTGAEPLSTADSERAATHLAEAFRLILAPLRAGTARLNRRAIKVLAELGANKVISS